MKKKVLWSFSAFKEENMFVPFLTTLVTLDESSSLNIKIREVCPSPILPRDKIEGLVVDYIKGYILTEENLEELVRLTNEELAQTSVVQHYTSDLRNLLARSSITEQRSFWKSFVEKIETDAEREEI